MTNEAGLEFEDKMTDKNKEALEAFNHWLFTWQTDPEVNKHVKTIRAALSSPRVPVIEGLDEANALFEGIDEIAEKYGQAAKEDVATQALLKIHKAARAYAALPKMQKVDLAIIRSYYFNFFTNRLKERRGDIGLAFNDIFDDIKAKYGELYAMEGESK